MGNHGWRIIKAAPTQHCSIFPSITGASQHWFIDTGVVQTTFDEPVLLSYPAVDALAKELGYINRGEARQMQEAYDAKVAEVNRLLERVDELENFKAAVKLISDEKKKAIAAERAVA